MISAYLLSFAITEFR